MAGIDPIAKRPRALDPAPQAAVRQMDAAQVAAGLCDVHGLVIRDEAYAAQLADCIDSNAVILMEVISRMKAVEAMVAQQGADAVQLHDKLVQEDLRIDTQLRGELGVMAQRLLDHDTELKAKLATEASKVADKITAFEDAHVNVNRPKQVRTGVFNHDLPSNGTFGMRHKIINSERTSILKRSATPPRGATSVMRPA